MNMYKSIRELTEKKPKAQTMNINENSIVELTYQAKILGVTRTKLINHYLENAINLTKKDKEFIELEQKQQTKNEQSFEKYQSLENPEVQIKKHAKKTKSAKA